MTGQLSRAALKLSRADDRSAGDRQGQQLLHAGMQALAHCVLVVLLCLWRVGNLRIQILACCTELVVPGFHVFRREHPTVVFALISCVGLC